MMDGKLINIDPEIMGGTPVFNGTRVPIKTLFEWLETETLESFFENFPTVSREQAIGILSTAREMVLNKPDINETTVG
jgi:uncharacterized protein (DUF433 family)